MKIGIIDDDTQFSQVIKHKIEENTCFSKSSIDVFNNDFKSLQLKDYDYLFIDILLIVKPQTLPIIITNKTAN